jgi:hypothetical protein
MPLEGSEVTREGAPGKMDAHGWEGLIATGQWGSRVVNLEEI